MGRGKKSRRKQPLKERRRRQAAFLAVLSGVLLLAGHFSGAAQWEQMLRTAARFVPVTLPVRLLFLAVLFVASVGGGLVVTAALLILQGRLLLGRLLILLGTGFGIVSFLYVLAVAIVEGDLLQTRNSVVVAVGVGLSVAARLRARE